MVRSNMPTIDPSRFEKKKLSIKGEIVLFYDSNSKVIMKTESKDFNSDSLYIFKTDDKQHKGYNNVYLLLKHIKTWNTLTYFEVLDKAKYIETINKSNNLNGFRFSVIDSNYFDKIPYINELFHSDNFVLTNVTYEFKDKTTYDPLTVKFEVERKEGEIRLVKPNEHKHGKNITYKPSIKPIRNRG